MKGQKKEREKVDTSHGAGKMDMPTLNRRRRRP
jgi:hypothetical protein